MSNDLTRRRAGNCAAVGGDRSTVPDMDTTLHALPDGAADVGEKLAEAVAAKFEEIDRLTAARNRAFSEARDALLQLRGHMSYRQIAARVGRSESTVRYLLNGREHTTPRTEVAA